MARAVFLARRGRALQGFQLSPSSIGAVAPFTPFASCFNAAMVSLSGLASPALAPRPPLLLPPRRITRRRCASRRRASARCAATSTSTTSTAPARQHGQSAVLAVNELGSCASSGRAWRLQAARDIQGERSAFGRTALGARASRLESRRFCCLLTSRHDRHGGDPRDHGGDGSAQELEDGPHHLLLRDVRQVRRQR